MVRALGELLACPPGGRVALIAVATPVWGARVTLLALLEWGIVATCYALAGRGPYRAAAPPRDPEQAPVPAAVPAATAGWEATAGSEARAAPPAPSPRRPDSGLDPALDELISAAAARPPEAEAEGRGGSGSRRDPDGVPG